MKVIEALDKVLKGEMDENTPCLIKFSNDVLPMKYDSIKQMFNYMPKIECLNYDFEIIEEIENLKPEKWGKLVIEEFKSQELSLRDIQIYLGMVIETQNEIIECLTNKEEK